jgi:hypothetical protein
VRKRQKKFFFLKMSNLNRDIFYLIFEQLQDDKNTLCSCLLVNKTWCEIIIPILWKNPWKSLKKENERSLLSVIISHLSDVSKSKIRELDLLKNSYQRPSFDYISFCKHLNLDEIQKIINENTYEKNENLMVRNEVFSLFIDENMKFTHLYIHQKFDEMNNLILGIESCFSGIEFLSCSTNMDDTILSKLIETCKSIKKLKLIICARNNNYEIVKLIEAQKKLYNISIVPLYSNDSFCNVLENSLIKHANTIQYYKITERPTTNILSSFVNLKGLELNSRDMNSRDNLNLEWSCLKNLSLPFLQILKASHVPVRDLTELIQNTNGFLFEIKIDYAYHNNVDNKRIIQTIYQNCPNLKYLNLVFRNSNIILLEKLLINCQYLNGLYILVYDNPFDWDVLFKILTNSPSTSLFKFKFSSEPKLESLKLFFDSWKGRHPMLLEIPFYGDIHLKLMERYKAEGVIKKFNNRWNSEDSEWV